MAFERLPVAIQRQSLYVQLTELGIEPDFELIERLRCAPGQGVAVNPRASVARDGTGRVKLGRIELCQFNSNQTAVDLSAGQGRALFGNVEIRWEIASEKQGGRRFTRAATGCEYFDADKIGASIVLRHWRAGDRFHPIGLRSAVKLQDFFTNEKIRRAERHQRVVATTAQNEIFWVEGLRISECFKLEKETARRLKWCWRRQNDSPARRTLG